MALEAFVLQCLDSIHFGADRHDVIFARARAAFREEGHAALLAPAAPLAALAALRESELGADPAAHIGWVGGVDCGAQTAAAVRALLHLTASANAGVGPLDAGAGTAASAVGALCRMLEPQNRSVDGAFSLHSCAVRYLCLLCHLGPSEALCSALAEGGAVNSLFTVLVRRTLLSSDAADAFFPSRLRCCTLVALALT